MGKRYENLSTDERSRRETIRHRDIIRKQRKEKAPVNKVKR